MCQVLRASDVVTAKDEKAVQAVYNIWWLVSDVVASLGGTLTSSPRLTTWKVRSSLTLTPGASRSAAILMQA